MWQIKHVKTFTCLYAEKAHGMMDRRSAYPPMIRPSCGCAHLEVYVPARWSVNSLQCDAVDRPMPGRRQLSLTVVSFTARGVVLKRSGGRLKQDLDTKIILHCVSVSNQLQQRTNFCTNFSPKKWGSGDAGSGGRGPLTKKVEDAVSPPHYTPVYCAIGLCNNVAVQCHSRAGLFSAAWPTARPSAPRRL